MNCVAIPPPEEKHQHHQQQPTLQILHNELHILPTPHATPDTSGGALTKTQSLQRSIGSASATTSATTAHLYCRSLEKERGDRRSSSRGLASCLRGERDEFVGDYREMRPRAQQIDLPPTVVYTQGGGGGAVMGESAVAVHGNSGGAMESGHVDASGRCEYKSKTLPRIHFDTSINDTSLNEGKKYLKKSYAYIYTNTSA